jgi:seryl-tRNA synthetase
MLDPTLIRAEPARVQAALGRRGMAAEAVQGAAECDARWLARQAVADALRTRRRRASEEVARAKAAGEPTADLERAGREAADELRQVEADLAHLEAERDEALLALPNLPASDVPEETTVVHETPPRARCGLVRRLVRHSPTCPPQPAGRRRKGEGGSSGALTHWDLVKLLALAHPAEASAGGGFLVWRGAGARLLGALETLMLQVHTRRFGYEEVRCPAVATREALEGSAHLPALEEKMYAVLAPGTDPSLTRLRQGYGGQALGASDRNDMFLAPRAEPHLANLFRGQVLDAGALPARFVASGPAFRRESAHGGAKGRGLLRLHEFPTVEVYAFTRPEESEAELARAAEAATAILALLEVPHRRLFRGARSLSHAAAKTIDLEVWAGATERWLPVAALSSFTDYQARRTETRYRAADGKPRLVHTVGGAAVAIPHLVAALLENGQEADGSVRLPEALRPYMGGLDRLLPPKPSDACGTKE